jgi:hypothetical protein
MNQEMKRLRPQLDVVNVVIPIEIFITVCAQNWDLSCLFICVSRAFVYALTRPSVLRQIVEFALQYGYVYPWMLCSMSEHLLPHRVVKLDYLSSPHHVFVTGEEIARMVYGKKSEPSIAVWSSELATCTIQRTESSYLVYTKTSQNDAPHTKLSECDVSLLQQGYYLDTGESFCTPLSLYTQLTGVIVVLPERMDPYLGENPLYSPWRHIMDHEEKHDGYYHNCTQSSCYKMGAIYEWCERLCCYDKEFPECRMIYTRTLRSAANLFEYEMWPMTPYIAYPDEEYTHLMKRLDVLKDKTEELCLID